MQKSMKETILEALKNNQDYLDEILNQINSIEFDLKKDLCDLAEVQDGCIFLWYDELDKLIDYFPEGYKKILQYRIEERMNKQINNEISPKGPKPIINF